MKDENQSTESSIIIKGVRPKTIILIVLTILALFVVYEYISSKIQESKEKVIIQEQEDKEKALLEEKEKASEKEKQEAAKKQQEVDRKQQEITQQLNNCLDEADQKKNDSVLYWTVDFKTKTCDNAYYQTVRVDCLKGVMESVNKAKAEAVVDRDDCYKRYK